MWLNAVVCAMSAIELGRGQLRALKRFWCALASPGFMPYRKCGVVAAARAVALVVWRAGLASIGSVGAASALAAAAVSQ